MKSVMDSLNWAKGIESEGTAQVVDVKEAKAHVDVKDVEPNDLKDVRDTETEPNTDGGDLVEAETNHDIVGSVEDYEAGVISGEAGGKVIEAFAVEPKSNTPKRFVISGYNAQTNPAAEAGDNLLSTVILMQNGIIPDVGLNGVTAEDLLKVIEETFVCFQEGQFACEENDQVLVHIRGALAAIASRLNRREDQGTEGTYQGN